MDNDKRETINQLEQIIKSMQFKNKEELNNYINSNYNLPEEDKEKLFELFDETTKLNKGIEITNQTNYQNLLLNIENKIKNKEYQSKEELVEYLDSLKKQGIPNNILSEDKIKELLELYDTMNPVIDDNLDLKNYKGSSLENQNVIIATEKESVLKTTNTPQELPEEFRTYQNELTATEGNKLANSDEVFDYMRNYKKEEINLISISEAINHENIDTEILNKIKFFITSKYADPYMYKVDVDTGIFYNIETDEVLEVRINKETGKYEIYKGSEKVYEDTNSQELAKDTESEKIEKENVKVRKLVPPKLDSSAFIKGTLLIIMSVISALIISIFLLKFM